MKSVAGLAAVVVVASTAIVAGQQFEVASVKKSPPADGPIMIQAGARKGDQWLANNATLRMLIRSAYAPQYGMEGTIVGGPPWTDTDRFDVVAKSGPGATFDDMKAMARAMLAERFKLTVRQEKRSLPVYALVLSRSDGRLGSQMTPAGVDCEEYRAARKQAGQPLAEPRTRGGPMPRCITGNMFSSVSRIESGGMTMEQLAGSLSQFTGRPVSDRTGLKGYYVLTLEFSAEPGAVTPFGPVTAPTSANPSLETPSLFSAIQDQLGLKLEVRNEPTDVLVIDSAQQPTEN